MSAWLLVVNGEVSEGLALLRQLEHLGHRGTLAPGPRSALELLDDEDYDLVMIDARFLEAGGSEVIGRRAPVIVTDATEGSHITCRWLETGAADYLPAGACPPRLRARIDAALAARRAHDLQADYRQQVDRLLAAAAGGRGREALASDALARAGPWAGLARAFLALADENRALRYPAGPTPARAGP